MRPRCGHHLDHEWWGALVERVGSGLCGAGKMVVWVEALLEERRRYWRQRWRYGGGHGGNKGGEGGSGGVEGDGGGSAGAGGSGGGVGG